MNPVKAIIICAPSGGGKGESTKYITRNYPDKFTLSVSATTRDPDYSKEKNGVDYHFLGRLEFETLIKGDKFLEHKEVYNGDMYGTLYSEVERANSEGKILILEIDIEGAKDVKEKLGDQVKLLFVDAGDDVSLYENRIRSRGRIVSEEKIVQRVAKIPTELTEGRRIADGIIKNQGTLEEYHMEIKKCLLENGLIDDNNEKSRGIRSFKIQ